MSELRFRNRQGHLVEIPTAAATQAKNEFGAILDRAIAEGAVAITRHDVVKAVLVAVDEFGALVDARTQSLESLDGQFDDLLARMQTEESRSALDAAFHASPAELGAAAVLAAAKRPGGAVVHARRRRRPAAK